MLRKPFLGNLSGGSHPPVHDDLQTWPGVVRAGACVPDWVIGFPPNGTVPLPLRTWADEPLITHPNRYITSVIVSSRKLSPTSWVGALGEFEKCMWTHLHHLLQHTKSRDS